MNDTFLNIDIFYINRHNTIRTTQMKNNLIDFKIDSL